MTVSSSTQIVPRVIAMTARVTESSRDFARRGRRGDGDAVGAAGGGSGGPSEGSLGSVVLDSRRHHGCLLSMAVEPGRSAVRCSAGSGGEDASAGRLVKSAKTARAAKPTTTAGNGLGALTPIAPIMVATAA